MSMVLNIFGDVPSSVRHTDSFATVILQSQNEVHHKSLFPNAIGISITALVIGVREAFFFTCSDIGSTCPDHLEHTV